MLGRIEIVDVKFHARIKRVSKEDIDGALLGSGYSAAFHNVPNLYPRPKLPEGLIAGGGVLAPHRSVEVRARVGYVEFSIVNEKAIKYVLTHLDEDYRHGTDAGFQYLETSRGQRLYTWGEPPE